jgi:CrcB protein
VTELLVAAGAAVGAPLRYLLGLRWDTDRFPWGIWSANLLGSLVLGVLVGAETAGSAMALLGTGFCGGFTTYSSFAVATAERGVRGGATYAALTIGLALPSCALGFWVGAALS